MALTLDASVGGSGSNSYLDRGAATALLEAVPNADAWTAAAASQQDRALVHATTMLDTLAYQGQKTESTQALAWPREDVADPDYGERNVVGAWDCVYLPDDAIPRRVQRACAQLALIILRAGTEDVWGEDETLDFAGESLAGVTATQYVAPHQRQRGLRRYPQVWRELAPLTAGALGARVERG